jgi:SAM-dependent methyltransferase
MPEAGTSPSGEDGANASASPGRLLLHMAVGKWVCRALHVAADLGVADVLRDGPRRVEEIAARTSVDPGALYRVLRALAGVGVFEEGEERSFGNNALSSALRTDAPGTVRALVRWIGDEAAWRAWSELGQSVRTGAPAFDRVTGEPLFEYLASHRASGEVFDEAMASYSSVTSDAVARAYDFSRCTEIVDVGGGLGTQLVAIAERCPEARCVLFERPEVIVGARRALASAACAPRIELRAGDILEEAPAGADAYLLKHVLHDWDDERSVRILANCRRAMAPGGAILVVEQLVGEGPEASMTNLLDLEMLVMTQGGRQRTAGEISGLLRRADLRVARALATDSFVQVVEAVAASD